MTGQGGGGGEPRVTWAPSGGDRRDGAARRAETVAGKVPGGGCGHVSGDWEATHGGHSVESRTSFDQKTKALLLTLSISGP